MIGLLQRVSAAQVVVHGEVIAAINRGILVLVGVERGDCKAQADRLLERLLGYRVFGDAEDKMNLCVRDIAGGVLLVPQFTLAADTRKGNRPSFIKAAAPKLAKPLYERFCAELESLGVAVQTGVFAAEMAVGLTNDGPVTIWFDTADR